MVSYTWQWVRVDADGASSPADISGATSSTYVLQSADKGKRVRVRASFTDDGGNRETLTSRDFPATGTIAVAGSTAGNATGAPSISTARFGQWIEGVTVTGRTGSVGDPDGIAGSRFTLEWLRCDASGNDCDTVVGRRSTYRLASADAGRRLRARVRFQDDAGNEEARTSDPWPPLDRPAIHPYPACSAADVRALAGRTVILTGTLRVGYRALEASDTLPGAYDIHRYGYSLHSFIWKPLPPALHAWFEPS